MPKKRILRKNDVVLASQDPVTVTLKTAGKSFASSGSTIDQALEGLGLSWEQIKLKGILNVIVGDKNHEHLFNVVQLRRIFSNKLVRMFWAKNLEKLLK